MENHSGKVRIAHRDTLLVFIKKTGYHDHKKDKEQILKFENGKLQLYDEEGKKKIGNEIEVKGKNLVKIENCRSIHIIPKKSEENKEAVEGFWALLKDGENDLLGFGASKEEMENWVKVLKSAECNIKF